VIALIILLAALFLIAGLVLMIRPSLVIGFIETYEERTWMYASAVVIRLLLGLLLIRAAVHSRFPLTVEVVGWIILAAGLFLAVIGRRRFTLLTRWIIDKAKPFVLAGGLFATLFGAFLVFAFT
jgi:hypothetical protein